MANRQLKEKCPKCGHDKYAVSKDHRSTRYCDKCKHIWPPLTVDQMKLIAAKEEITELKKQNEALAEQCAEYEKILEENGVELVDETDDASILD